MPSCFLRGSGQETRLHLCYAEPGEDRLRSCPLRGWRRFSSPDGGATKVVQFACFVQGSFSSALHLCRSLVPLRKKFACTGSAFVPPGIWLEKRAMVTLCKANIDCHEQQPCTPAVHPGIQENYYSTL